HRGKTEQNGVIAEVTGDARLCYGLRGPADRTCDHHDRRFRPAPGRLGGELQHGPMEAGLTDLGLRGVDADRQTSGTGLYVIARQRALRDGVELAALVERERMRGNHGPAPQGFEHWSWPIVERQAHHANSGPATAKICRALSIGGYAPRSMRMKPRG